MQKATLKEKTAKGLFWGGFSTLVSQVVGAVFGVIIARILSPDDYGIIAMLTIFTAVVNVLMDSGFTTALINRRTIEHQDYNAVFWFNVFLSVGIYIVLFFAAPLIAKFYHQPVLTDLSRLLFLNFIFAGTGIAHNAILQKKIMAKERGIVDMAAVFISGAAGLILAIKGYAFWGLAVQQISLVLTQVVMRWYFSPWRPTFNFDFSPLKEMFGFSVKVLITSIFSIITANIFSVILGKYYGETMTGYYQQGYKWAWLVLTIIIGMITNTAQPVLFEAADDKKRQLNILRKMMRFGAFISLPVILGFAFISEEFILITIGEKWQPSVVFIQIFSLWHAFFFMWYLYMYLIFAHNKSGIYLKGVIIFNTIQILTVLLMVHLHIGILKMISVYLLQNFATLLYWHYHTNKLIGLRLIHVIKDITPFMIITATSIIVAWFATKGVENLYIRICAKIVITAAIYTATMWLSNAVIMRECYAFIIEKIKT